MNRNDKRLIAVLLAAAFSLTLLYHGYGREEGSRVVITVDGREYKTLDLSEDSTLRIEGAEGGANQLVIEAGSVRMEAADCPDQICVRQGAIRYCGESIVCLPNRLVVRIAGSAEPEVDAVQ